MFLIKIKKLQNKKIYKININFFSNTKKYFENLNYYYRYLKIN